MTECQTVILIRDDYMGRLAEKYKKEVIQKLKEEFEIENLMGVPSLEKIVLNMGIGEAAKNKEALETLKKDMAAMVGQVPVIRKAKVSIASFNLRRGMPVGLSATLRGERMYSFFDKFVSIVLPRLRDFRGVAAKSFDKKGNYTIGFAEYVVFPEIDVTKTSGNHGLEITFVVKSSDEKKSKRLFELMGLPFEKEEK